MSASAPRRFRRIASAGLVATVAAASVLVFSAAPASAAAPVIVNSANGASPSPMGNWLENNAVASADRSAGVGAPSDAIFGTMVVQHDPGRTVTGLAIDSDWGATDETATVAPVGVTSTQVPNGDSNYSTVRFSYNPPDHPDLRATTVVLCLFGGNSTPSGPQRIRAVLDDGTRTAVVSNTVFMNLSGDCSGTEERPTIFSATQSATTVAPGGTVSFGLKGDDPDSGSTNAGVFDKYRWRVRRLNDGAIVQGPTCVDIAGTNADNLQQSFGVTFAAAAGRGRYIVEAEAGNGNETCPSGNFNNNAAATAKWWRLGAVDVNTAAATAPTITLAGAPAVVQAGNTYTVTATTSDAAADVTGRVQAIEWDADGAATFERRVLATEPTGIVAADKAQLVTTVVNQCADRTVTARITDNGAMNGADPTRAQATASATSIVNCKPIANDQPVTMNEDTPASFTVLPTDGDGDALTYSVATPPLHGDITGSFPNFVYAPDDDFNGIDSYTYRVDDINGAFDTATVTFTVAPINDTPNADDVSVSTNEDNQVVIDLAPYVSDVDENDAAPQTLTVSVLTPPGTGVATATGPTEITYVPNPPPDFHGVVSFTYEVNDGSGAVNDTDGATITVTIDPVDDQPVAADQSLTTPEDTNLPMTLGPTVDVDGEDVTYSVAPLNQPAHGVVTVIGTSATYDPDPNYFGPDHFFFEATDGISVITGRIDVDVTAVNDAPVAGDQSVSTDEDVDLPIVLAATDVDTDQEDLVFHVSVGPNHGTLDTVDGTDIVYSPDPDYFGLDSITFTVTDGEFTDSGSITITVNPVDDAPIADDQAVVTDEDTPAPILLTASDIDNTQAQLQYSILVEPQFGTLSGELDGQGNDLVYTPNLNYSGPDSFEFDVFDGELHDQGTVTITVVGTNDAPEAIPQVVSTSEDTALPVHLDATDEDDATNTLTFQVISGPSNGTLDTTSGQDVVYTPNLDYNGFDAFVFQVTDPGGLDDIATVVIAVGEVGTNDPPTADDQSVSTDEDQDLGIVLTASDVDGDDLTYSIDVAPAHGTAIISNDVILYSPNLNEHGTDLIVFKVEDGHGGFNFGSIHLTVNSVNDAPDAIPATVELLEDTVTPITLTGSDIDGDAITFAVTSPPSHGTVTGSAPNVAYTPDTDYFGNDSFEFTVTDTHGATGTSTISLVVDAAPKTITSMFAEGAILTVGHLGSLVIVSIPLTAHLTDRVTGAGIAGKTVVFSTGNGTQLCTAVTSATGEAYCSSTLALASIQAILNLGYNASFAGDEDNTAATDNGPLIRLFGLNVL